MSIPPKIPGLSPAELQRLVVQLLEDVAELKHVVAEQREEIARLKGLKGRPNIKPSGMENVSTRKPPQNVKQVGRELGVRYVLEGSVRKGGNRLTRAHGCERHTCARRTGTTCRQYAVHSEPTEGSPS
jgi:hypothetical protein